MRILFINAINYKSRVENYFPPLALGYLISSLKKEFGLDSVKFKIIDRNIESEIVKNKPDIVGITAVTQNYNRAIKYAKIAKKYEIPVIIGGVHISTLPESLTDEMDIGVIGEGEETIKDIVRIFCQRGKFAKDDIKRINGVCFKNDSKVILTPPRKLIDNLDDIPLPDRSFFNIGAYASMFTSRGCPYRCSFCASSRFWNKVRFFSAQYVVNEIEYLVFNYGMKTIMLYDDLFFANVKRVEQITELLEKNKILGKVVFYGAIRANLVSEKMVERMRLMNFKTIGLGLESGSETTLQYLKGDSVTVEDNRNAVRILKKYGIAVNGSFIIGAPYETREDVYKTIKFIKDNPLDNLDAYCLTPFPGTPVWDYAKKEGFVSNSMNWDNLSVDFKKNHKTGVIISKTLRRRELYLLWSKIYQQKKILQLKHQYKVYLKLLEGIVKNPSKLSKFLYKKLKWFSKYD